MTSRDVPNQQRRAAVFRHDDRADVLGRSQQTHAANQILLLALFDVVPAGIHVAATERGEDLLQS